MRITNGSQYSAKKNIPDTHLLAHVTPVSASDLVTLPSHRNTREELKLHAWQRATVSEQNKLNYPERPLVESRIASQRVCGKKHCGYETNRKASIIHLNVLWLKYGNAWKGATYI